MMYIVLYYFMVLEDLSLVTFSFQHLGYFSSSPCFKIFPPVLCGQRQDWGAFREERHKITKYFP